MIVVPRLRLVVTALALVAVPALAQDGGEYTGAAHVIHSVRDVVPWPQVARLSVHIAALDSAHRRVLIEFNTEGARSDSGIAARWGDSLIAATTGPLGDSTIWLGVWIGDSYSGRYLVTAGASEGRYGQWTATLVRGDPLAESGPPPLEFRNSFYALLKKNRRGEARQKAGLSFDPLVAPPTPATPMRRTSPSSDTSSEWLGYAILALVIISYAFEVKRTLPSRLAAWRARPPKPNPPGGYAVPCPYCGTERMQIAKKYYVVRGIGVFTRIEPQIIAGCTRCVQRNGTMTCARALLYGPWSLGGLVSTPFILCYDLYILFDIARPALVESLIRNAGLDPFLVKVDENGMTMLQQRHLEAVAYACAMIVWARGERAAKAFTHSARYLRTLYNGILTDERLAAMLDQSRNRMPPPPLNAELRPPVLKLLRTLATADGELSRAVVAALMVAGQGIGCTEREMNEMVQQLMTEARENAAARAREEAAAQAREREQARARAEEKARESRQRAGSNGSNNNGHHSRPARRGRDDLDRARSVLGVTASAEFDEIVRAYRANIAIWHPDRAGLDVRKALEFTDKAKELTWAMEALRRAMQAQAS